MQAFTPWKPHDLIPQRVEVTSVRDEGEGLSVTIAAEDERADLVKLIFEDFVAYRNINESFRIRTWEVQDLRDLPSLIIVEESTWLKWLIEESGGILDGTLLKHYAIYTGDDCIDVASRSPPTVVVLD